MKSEQEIYDEQLEEIKKIAIKTMSDDLLDIQVFYNIETKTFGIIYVDHDSENLDNHCEQCMGEFSFLRFANLPNTSSKEILPFYYIACCGETKFNKIKTKDFKFEGFTSDEIKIID